MTKLMANTCALFLGASILAGCGVDGADTGTEEETGQVGQAAVSLPFKVGSVSATGLCWSNTSPVSLVNCDFAPVGHYQIADPVVSGGKSYYQFRLLNTTTCLEHNGSSFVLAACADAVTQPGQWWSAVLIPGTLHYQLESMRFPGDCITNWSNSLVRSWCNPSFPDSQRWMQK